MRARHTVPVIFCIEWENVSKRLTSTVCVVANREGGTHVFASEMDEKTFLLVGDLNDMNPARQHTDSEGVCVCICVCYDGLSK